MEMEEAIRMMEEALQGHEIHLQDAINCGDDKCVEIARRSGERIRMAIDAMRKQVPAEMDRVDIYRDGRKMKNQRRCPGCGKIGAVFGRYCPDCGQRLKEEKKHD